jgi:predicted glycosyltransferase
LRQPAITARDYGITFDLLRSEGVPFHAVGASYGRRRTQKLIGIVRRARSLRSFARSWRPSALIHAGRASALVARHLTITALSLCDYEYADLTFERLSRTYVAFPDAIDSGVFIRKGIALDRLIPFAGLKEDLSFAGMSLSDVEPYPLPASASDAVVRALFRPPAEESHYYHSESGRLVEEALAYLAGRDDVLVIFAPRYEWQAAQLDRLHWSNVPIVLSKAAPFVPLLRAVDAVLSSGGTMVREAAYLGVPAYSLFRGELGGVDRHLARIGRLRLVESANDLESLRRHRTARFDVLDSNPGLVNELVDVLDERVRRAVPT